MMELLLDSGASSSSALELAVENGHTDVVRIMLRRLWTDHLENGHKQGYWDCEIENAFNEAVQHDHVDVIKAFLTFQGLPPQNRSLDLLLLIWLSVVTEQLYGCYWTLASNLKMRHWGAL